MLIGVGYGGNMAWTKFSLRNINLDPIPSGDVCLLAINKEAGVQIITANQMVQVVESTSKFGADVGNSGDGATSGAVKRRIPVRELIGVLNGESDAVPVFIKKMGNTGEDVDSSDDAPLWSKEDIEKAIQGDASLRSRLENDISMKIDGTPLPILNRSAFFNGIRVKVPISLDIPNAKGPKLDAYAIESFRPRFLAEFFKSMREKFYDKAQLQTYYKAYLDKEKPQDQPLEANISQIFKRSMTTEEVRKVTQISTHTHVLASQQMISSAEMKEDSEGKEKTYDLKIHLTPEGKNRLWKFSADGGTQVIVVSKGVAIAAATIGTQLNSEELIIKQIANKSLVQEVVDLLQSHK